ncbi:MAG: SusC/RagA family TonB-linked outer membrane protein [Gemmatimonadota bacterium]|nr:SusC/RagA family TonB-linked outer membrane protein [Gemmatimonadota bacterium]MDQ8166322.1 SusC/RagA family TonB-linked outer membrane protein [Gemmatimonadota bacterium]MDQ8172256.1 SusC/RagA family TonB-linked outer membrane protein [Gemmatimonadota bacterium]
MHHPWRVLLALAGTIAVAAPAARAQSGPGSLSVRVTDAANQRPVEAARVFLVGTAIGGATSTDGRLTLRGIPAAEYTVRVLRVGYTEQTKRVPIAAGQTATVEFAMATAAVNLAAVVTTATGEQRRVEIGNATANIDASKVLEAAPVSNLNDLLNSRAPGVTVTSGSQTGTGSRIRVRGMNSVSLSNEPIWIIDGIRMTSDNASFSTATGSGGTTGGNNASRVGDLNPEEIENIEIVKGPSAATLYGTDAANGVILVTTKKGRAGAAKWNVYGEGGTLFDKNYYPSAYSLWGKRPGETVSSRAFCNLQRVGNGECAADSTSSLNIFDEADLTPVATGARRQAGVQVSGGTEAVRYFFSVEDEKETGVLSLPQFERQRFDSLALPLYPWTSRPNVMARKSLRMNLNSAISPKLDLAVSTNFINIAQRYSLESNATAGLGSHLFGGPGTRANGTVSGLGTPLNGYRAWTPGYMWQEKTSQEVNRFLWSANANWRPFSWLANRATVGNDYTGRADENLLLRGQGPPLTATTRLGARGINRVNINNVTVDLGSTATYALAGMSLKTTVGAQYIGYKFASAATGATQLAPGSQNVGSGTIPTVSEGTTVQKTFGVFIEQALNVGDRLFLTAAVRSDQNSAFGTNFQSILYPKASASYLISQEEWWKAPAFVNSVRLRYAYGQSGVQPGPNDAIRFFTASSTSIAATDQPTVIQAALGNDNLKPERSAEQETGFEVQMFDSRINLDATYYSKITKDALISAVLPPSYGSVASQLRNLGAVKNAGVEVAINAQILQGEKLGWDVNLAGSANDNKVVSLGDNPPQVGTTSRTVAGYPIGGLWARPITGYEDKNGDGLLTYFADAARNEVFVGDSAIFRGYATPRYMVTLGSGFDLFSRKLRISTMLDYRSGNKWYNNTERIRCTRPNCAGRLDLEADFIDQATNIAANEHPARTLDGFFQPGAFVRLREMSVQYTVAPALAQKLTRARSLNVVLTGRNLWLKTKYRGTDPESAFNSTSGTEAPSEFQTVGPPSYFIFRVNVGY